MLKTIRKITAEEFAEMLDADQKADLLDGMVYIALPDSPDSAGVNVFLSALLAFFVGRMRIGQIYGPRSAFQLSDHYAPEPDIAFVRTERLGCWRKSLFQGAPDLAVEIVSPDSIERDTVHKRGTYERAGVAEYWLVDLVKGKCIFLRLEDGGYREVPLGGGSIFRSQVIPGFWLDTKWLLGSDLPPLDECLAKILA